MTMRWLRIMLLSMTTAMAAHGSVTKTAFGTAPDGAAVELYTLKSEGIEANITTFGARVVSIKTPDRDGKIADVVLGYNSLDGYLADKSTYFGAIVGRYGNRIAFGKFSLDGHQYQIPTNNGANSLHGGTVGFDRMVWQARAIPDGVEMTLVSKDGDQGYPGTLTVHVRYTVHHGALRIDYSSSTDKDTVLNLTNHSYFNLSGDAKNTILGEEGMIPADQYTPVDSGKIPTGTRASGEGRRAGRVYDPVTGRVCTVTTTEPGVQFYTGNSLDGTPYGSAQETHAKNTGLCLETQHFPDSPNHPAFPSTELKPGEVRHSTTTFTFSTHAK